MIPTFESLPRRIFLDSCTVQTLRNYGGYIFDGESIANTDRIHRVTKGLANVEALRDIFLINERASFEWIVSSGSLLEAQAKRDPGHTRWLRDIAHHSETCLLDGGPSVEAAPVRLVSVSRSLATSAIKIAGFCGTQSYFAVRPS